MSPVVQYVVQALVTLVGIALLSYLLLRVGRRWNQLPSHGPLQLVGRLPLEGRRVIYLVRVGERVLVLAASEQRMEKVADLEAATLGDVAETQRNPFAELLKGIGAPTRPRAAQTTPAPSFAEPSAPSQEMDTSDTDGIVRTPPEDKPARENPVKKGATRE